MKVGPIPENWIDRAAMLAGLVPTPLADTIVTVWLARTIMVGTKLGIFEALLEGARRAEEVAQRCGTDRAATGKLLTALAGAGYLDYDNGLFSLSSVSRKWMLKSSLRSLRDSVLAQLWQWELVEHYEDFVRTGKPIDLHRDLTPQTWGLYMRYMQANARLSAPELARRVKVPRGARLMLDIGGSHGYYSVALCRRHRGLRAVVLDLPEAIEGAAPLLARERMGSRVVHRAGNALTQDLGTAVYGVVLIANLVHHFNEETNRALVRRVAQALKPGGTLAILEIIRPRSPRAAGQVGALADLYFSALSEAGTWSFAEIAGWQRAAGLSPRRPVRLLTIPGHGLQMATKAH